MIKIQNATTESALCTGMILALLWGIGISVRGLLQEPALTWLDWFLQLTLGILAAVAVPLLLVRCADWTTRRIEGMRRRSSRALQS